MRNIAIVAHVDHGKTTLVDSMLRQAKVHSRSFLFHSEINFKILMLRKALLCREEYVLNENTLERTTNYL